MDEAARLEVQLPTSWRLEPMGAVITWYVYSYRRESEKALAALRMVTSDDLLSPFYSGPKGLLVGDLLEMGGHTDAAQVEWSVALKAVEQRFASAPNDQGLLETKIVLLDRLGQRAEAERLWRLDLGLYGEDLTGGARPHLMVTMEPVDRAIDVLEKLVRGPIGSTVPTAAMLRYDPMYDPLRKSPRFAALLALAEADPRLSPKTTEKSAQKTDAPDQKSVAVLPFANLSGDPAQDYFSDGLTEEILNALARERDLRVVPRTSAFSFKGKNLPLPEIARALNVAQVVEGSVRRAGNTVRIDCTLTRVSDGFAQPLPQFEREMKDASGIFALEDDVARAVVQKLTGRDAKTESPVATQNVAAYEAYLHGRELLTQTSPSWPEAIESFQHAVDEDPAFALAWANLGRACLQLAWLQPSATRVARGRSAVAESLRRDPELPEAHLAQALAISIDGNHLADAMRELDAADALRPNDASIISARAWLTLQQGNRPLAIALARRAVELDPRNGANLNQFGNFLHLDGQYAEAEQAYRAAFEILGTSIPLTNLALNQFLRDGDVRAVVRALDAVPSELRGSHYWGARQALLYAAGDFGDSLATREHTDASGNPASALFSAMALEAAGDQAGAEQEYRRALERLDKFWAELPNSEQYYAGRARALEGLGRKDEAIAAAEKALELLPPDENPFNASGGLGYYQGFGRYAVLANVLAKFGRADEALAIIEKEVAAGWWRRNNLRFNPDWVPLRKDPRFQAIVSKAPL